MINIVSSIVIYKHKYAELKDTLNCLIASNHIQKIILVDNDESDWASTFKHEKVIYLKSQANFGFGYGHNQAISKYAEDSDFFLICNPDIMFEESEFDNLVKFASQRNEGLFLPKIVYSNGENQFGARLLPTPLNLFARRFSKKMAGSLDQKYLLKSFSIEKPIFAPYLSGCFMLFRSELLLKLNGFDERFFMYMEDVDLSRRCAERFGNVYYPYAQVVHVHEQASYKNKLLLKAHLKSAIQYFNKWGWVYDVSRSKLNKKCLNQFRT
ncbi:glycosyltransferase [Acinetobacter baumannii]|uniref:glycosyltransferase n=1 Tax=Acinetobacter baumannii TaxID=470 RepID=UPI001126E14E|nr:glycosyltransferase [Acinetobacter baumannii]TPT33441.1 glycosyltransferase [Acinetobacter baumannii]UEH20137.1 Gtr157 [Acinetobacter baumannii]